MHDMVRELTRKKAEEESLGSFDEQGRQKLTGNPRWLGFTSEMNLRSLKNSPKFRALLLMPSLKVALDSHISSLHSLRVLDFSLNKIETSADDLLKRVCSLKRLSYLNLSGVPITKLPKALRNLSNLQIFILHGCSGLLQLNQSIISLRKLVILDLGSCNLKFLPKGIGQLAHLEELSGFRVGHQANKQICRFDELKELKNLRVLRMNIGEESDILSEEMGVLSKLERVKVLSIDTELCVSENIPQTLDGLSPPSNLQELYLRRYSHGNVPRWVNPDKLSSLRYLCLENGDLVDIEASGVENRSTWNIEGLCFKVLPELRVDWRKLRKDMPLLQYAEVSGCFNLQNCPFSTEKPVIWKKR